MQGTKHSLFLLPQRELSTKCEPVNRAFNWVSMQCKCHRSMTELRKLLRKVQNVVFEANGMEWNGGVPELIPVRQTQN